MKVNFNEGIGGPKPVYEFENSRFDADRVATIIEKVMGFALDRPEFQSEVLSDDSELLLHQDFSRTLMIYGVVLERLLDELLNEFPYEGVRLSREQKDEWFKLAFDEQTVSMHRLLMRRALENKSVSLGELTEIVYPQERTDDFNKKRKTVRNKFLVPMEEMWLWTVNAIERVNKHGKREISHYEIEAGPALKLFSRDVFAPLRRHTLKQLCNQF